MFPIHHPCIDINEHEFLGGLFSPPYGRKEKHQERNNEKTCHAATLK
jgi:hypothetical protein